MCQPRYVLSLSNRFVLNQLSLEIIQVEEIPYTLNGKRVEVLVKKVNDIQFLDTSLI